MEYVGQGSRNGLLQIVGGHYVSSSDPDVDLIPLPRYSMAWRYWLLLRQESPVRPTREKYGPLPEVGIVAKCDIPKDSYILELSGVLSSSSVPKEMPYLSVIERRRGKKAYKALMAGPLRFVNHHCHPNAVVSLIPAPRSKPRHIT